MEEIKFNIEFDLKNNSNKNKISGKTIMCHLIDPNPMIVSLILCMKWNDWLKKKKINGRIQT